MRGPVQCWFYGCKNDAVEPIAYCQQHLTEEGRTAQQQCGEQPQARTRVTDFHLALNRIDRLLEQHEPKHKGAWKNQDTHQHLIHEIVHATVAKMLVEQDPGLGGDLDAELASNACRALMALEQWLRRS